MPGKAPQPAVHWSTWLTGVLEVLLVGFILFSSFRISRRLTSDRIKIQQAGPAPEPELDLVDA